MAAKVTEMFMLEAMDSLWFHHIVLFSEQSLFLSPEIPKTPLHTSESAVCSSKSSSQSSVNSEQEISPLAYVITGSQDDETSSLESGHDKLTTTTLESQRPTRLNMLSTKTRYNSSSPISAQKKPRKIRHSQYSAMKLQKSMSCKSLEELEIEEVKGFMDLGFNFKQEKLSKHLIKLIPGLQRINNNDDSAEDEEDNDDDEENKGTMMRPYLSEAWLEKTPNSQSLNLRLTSVCSNADMKKHLKCWARTIASIIQEPNM